MSFAARDLVWRCYRGMRGLINGNRCSVGDVCCWMYEYNNSRSTVALFHCRSYAIQILISLDVVNSPSPVTHQHSTEPLIRELSST